MNVWLGALSGLLLVGLAVVRLLRPIRPELSDFERSRRTKLRDAMALIEQRRSRALPRLLVVRRIVSALLLLSLLAALSALLGIGWGSVVIIVMVFLNGIPDRTTSRPVARLYARIEPGLLKAAESRPLKWLPVGKPEHDETTVHSTEELTHVVARAPFLDARERELVTAALEFPRLLVRDVMRQKSALKTIDKGEVLGPLVIDDLYKTGESVFLVTDGDIDTVVGLLPLEKLTGLELTGSPNALKAMDDTVGFIGETEPVGEALRQLREADVSLLVVQDAAGRTVGALALDDIIDRLFALS